MKSKVVLIFCFLSLLNCAFAQQEKEYVFFSNSPADDKLISLIESELVGAEKAELISLGDNKSDLLNALTSTCPTCKLRTVIGDKDVSQLLQPETGDYKFKKKRICPDPIVKELDDNHVMIIINSNWFIDREFKFNAQNFDCEFYNEIHLLEGLEDILDDYNEWNKIIVAHHGIESISERAGKGLWLYNFIPIYGQLYQSYRQNIGDKQDLASVEYYKYLSLLSKIVTKFDKLCIVSGHDYLNHVIDAEHITHINVNSSDRKFKYSKNKQTRFASRDNHILGLKKRQGQWTFSLRSYESNTEISDVFKIKSQTAEDQIKEMPSDVSSTVRASEKYDANGVTRFFMGDGYRDEWSTPVNAPLLDITTYDGGLRPYAIGGGLQTMSVKFKSNNGKKYAFRVLDKQPEKSLSDIARESIYRVIVQELITTMHPYGPLVANSLLDATDIIHIKPELFILKEHPKLEGEFQQFVGKIGTLEEKPSGKKKGRKGFYGADKVVSSFDMFISLRKSHKNRIDRQAYAKARLMDMLLGDWDRHEDNWKWAMFKEGKKKIYHPIPKDRDHVFSKWSGLIPNIADFAINNAEDFADQFGNLRHLNFKARFLDRELAAEISLEDWLEASAYLQDVLTDEVIDNAVKQLPPEVYPFHAEEIKSKLKTRRADMDRFITAYYKELNASVFITGTNKSDLFEIHRNDDGSVEVKIFDIKKDGSKGEHYFSRKCEADIVQKLYCFGLDGKDQFKVTGDVENSIKVRIIGGSDQDKISDLSFVKGKDRLTQIYDSTNKDEVRTSEETIIKRPSRPAYYDPYAFDYNWLIPNVNLRRSSGNGWGFGAGFTYLIRGYNKPGFAKKWTFGGIYYPSLNAYRLDGSFTFRHFVGLSDLKLRSQYSSLYDKYPFFYGIGNDTELDRRHRRRNNSIDYDFLDFEAGLENIFAQRSSISNVAFFEYHNVVNRNHNMAIDTNMLGYGRESYAGLRSKLDLDFTDNSQYPMYGSQFSLTMEARTNFNGELSSNINSRFSYYHTLNLGFKTTFIGSLHYRQANGDPAFYHLSRLGSQTHFRGYTRNRFIDKYALLYNSEMRINLGTIKTPLIQFVVGVFGFYDGGRVWNDSSEFYEGEWNNSYGGGFFFAPGTTNYTLSYLVAWPEDDFTYSKLQIGFDF